MKNITTNFFYQVIFQLTKILIPIITVPIVSKALGPDGVGMYNYSYSIAQYFVILAGLGVMLYGNRKISLSWHRKENYSLVFWEIFLLKAIITILSLTIYFIFIAFIGINSFLLVQSLTILATLFDVSWFFMGIEDFKKTSLSNLVVQIMTFCSILLFVKNQSDAITYTFIQAAGIVLSQVLVWPFLKKYIKKCKVSVRGVFTHFKGAFEFFIPQVAIVFYTNINKTIIGIFLGSAAVGFFSNSLQLNNVFITIITTLDVVLLPHMSGLYARDSEDLIIDTMEKTIDLQLYFSIPIMFGILTVFDKLVPWFFGEKFVFITKLIPILSPLVIIIPLGMAISRQYLMPVGKIKDYNRSVFIGAIINVVLNIILLPKFGLYGVIVANLVSEIFVTTVRLFYFVKNTKFSISLSRIGKYFVISLLMCLLTRFLTATLPPAIKTNLIQVAIAVPTYFLLTTIIRINPISRFFSSRR